MTGHPTDGQNSAGEAVFAAGAPTVVVLGALGMQASGLLKGLGRADTPMNLVLCDLGDGTKSGITAGAHHIRWESFDLLDSVELNRVLRGAAVVVNCTGPYFRLGPIVLGAAIAARTNYVDICDDADATELLLDMTASAEDAGISALIGMGSAPGMSNVLVRLALDVLPPGDASVEVTWTVDAEDMAGAVIPHFAHSFATAIPGTGSTPAWDDLGPRRVTFPEPVGEQLVVTLSHPEVLTLPRFTRATSVKNRGGLIPEDYTHLGWLLSRLPDYASKPSQLAKLYNDVYSQASGGRARVGSGMIVDVRVGDDGIRFEAGGTTSQEDATGLPAAAGTLLSIGQMVPGPGVFPAETLEPSAFFTALRKVSTGGGGLTSWRTERGEATERLRLRDLLGSAEHSTGGTPVVV